VINRAVSSSSATIAPSLVGRTIGEYFGGPSTHPYIIAIVWERI
jgi:hypothetical protein